MTTLSKIYISGALTGVSASSNIKKTYESIANVAETVCSTVYVPHMNTDPVKNADVTPEIVWRIDHYHVTTADVVIAYLGMPSLGVGQELEIARVGNAKIIGWWYKGENVSRMALGNPAVKHTIEAENEEDLLKELKKVLISFG
jgi:hypothetical protein